jgi:heat shock protein HslJ
MRAFHPDQARPRIGVGLRSAARVAPARVGIGLWPAARVRRAGARTLALVLAALVTVGSAACAPAPGGPPDGRPGGSLVGRTFVSTSVTENGQPRPLVEGTRIELSIPSRDRIGASAGCNQLSGPLTIERHRLVVGTLASTRIGCAPELHRQDEWLARFLTGDPFYVLRGDSLRLQVGGTVVELVDRDVAERVLVDYDKSGGFIGIQQNLVVFQDGRAVLDGGEPITLTPEQLGALVDVLEAADFATLPPDTIDPNVADAFIYEITYEGYRVVTNDGFLTPPQLWDVIRELNEIVTLFR